MFGMIDFVGNLAMVTTADTKYRSTASDRRLRSAQLIHRLAWPCLRNADAARCGTPGPSSSTY